jgi:hypothetical protein
MKAFQFPPRVADAFEILLAKIEKVLRSSSKIFFED